MPRRSKGARLELRPVRRDKSGKITHTSTWRIRDNGRDIGTGCAADEVAAAEQKLKEYIVSKYEPKRKERDIETIPIRWRKIAPGADHFVTYKGQAVASVVKTAFKTAVQLAGLEKGISPHTLRHTAATWLMQRGADPGQAAGYLGMSLEVLLNTYGHHHPDYLSDAVEKIAKRETKTERKPTERGIVSGAITGAASARGSEKR